MAPFFSYPRDSMGAEIPTVTVGDVQPSVHQRAPTKRVGAGPTQPILSVDDGVGYFAAMGERHRAEMEGRSA